MESAQEIQSNLHKCWDYKGQCFNRLMEKLEEMKLDEIASEVKKLNSAWYELAASWRKADQAGIRI